MSPERDSWKPSARAIAGAGLGMVPMRLGELAVARGFLTPARLDECVRRQEEERRGGRSRPLGEILREAGGLTEAQLQELQDEQRAQSLVPISPATSTVLPREAAEAAANPDRTLAQYVLVREIGRGGMSHVWRAWDRVLSRWVAVKVLRDEPSEEAQQRFLREAQAAARVHHPNLVDIHESGECQGRPYLVMELIEGRSFDVKGPLLGTVSILRKVALGLEQAHRQGVVHRDLKPGNIVVDGQGEPHVVDFGLAHLENTLVRITRAGSTFGTPQYMAPEQVEGRSDRIDGRTDLYALGAILYEALAGRPPYAGETVAEVHQKILAGNLVVPPGPADVRTICLKAVEREPERRYAGVAEFAEDLRRYLNGEPILARPRNLLYTIRRRVAKRKGALTVAAGLLLGLGLGVWGLWNLRSAWRYRELQAKLRPLADSIRETRNFFYIENADLRKKLGEVDGLLSNVETIAQDPGYAAFPDAWALLGIGRHFAGDPLRAEEALLKAESLGSDDPWVRHSLSKIYLERSFLSLGAGLGDRRDVHGRAREWVELGDRHRSPLGEPGELGRALTEGYRLLASGRHRDAAEYCRKAGENFRTAMGGEEFHVIEGMAHLFLGAENPDSRITAEQCYGRAIVRRPHYAWAFFQRGLVRKVLYELDRTQVEIRGQALDDFTAAIEKGLKIPHVYTHRSVLRHEQGDLDGAIEDCSAAIRIDPAYPYAWYKRGLAREMKKETNAALADYQQAIAVHPEYGMAYLRRGILRHGLGQMSEAMGDFQRVVALLPSFPDGYFVRGALRELMGDLEGAISDFEKALEVAPPNWNQRPEVTRRRDEAVRKKM